MQIGIIIPTSDGEQKLAKTLSFIKQRTTLPYQVVVPSLNGGYDNIAAAYGAEEIVTHASLGESKNLGAAHLFDSDIVVFLDAHCKVDAGWDVAIANALEDKQVGIATLWTYILKEDFSESMRGQGGAGYKWQYPFRRAWAGSDDKGSIDIVNGAFMALRSDVFYRLGGFIPVHNEDVELSLRSLRFGYRNVCGNDVKVGHIFKGGNTKLLFKPLSDYTLGDLLIAYLHYPEEEYEKEKKKHSTELVRYVEMQYKKLKEYIDENAVRGLDGCFP